MNIEPNNQIDFARREMLKQSDNKEQRFYPGKKKNIGLIELITRLINNEICLKENDETGNLIINEKDYGCQNRNEKENETRKHGKIEAEKIASINTQTKEIRKETKIIKKIEAEREMDIKMRKEGKSKKEEEISDDGGRNLINGKEKGIQKNLLKIKQKLKILQKKKKIKKGEKK